MRGAGTVNLQVEWFPEVPAACRRLLRITVKAAKELPKAGLFSSKNDPYCTVCVGGALQRTTTIQKGGTSAVWGAGEGEIMYFDLEVSTMPRIVLTCIDEDFVSADDEIGQANIGAGPHRMDFNRTRWP